MSLQQLFDLFATATRGYATMGCRSMARGYARMASATDERSYYIGYCEYMDGQQLYAQSWRMHREDLEWWDRVVRRARP
jgi:hypothetical protein